MASSQQQSQTLSCRDMGYSHCRHSAGWHLSSGLQSSAAYTLHPTSSVHSISVSLPVRVKLPAGVTPGSRYYCVLSFPPICPQMPNTQDLKDSSLSITYLPLLILLFLLFSPFFLPLGTPSLDWEALVHQTAKPCQICWDTLCESSTKEMQRSAVHVSVDL